MTEDSAVTQTNAENETLPRHKWLWKGLKNDRLWLYVRIVLALGMLALVVRFADLPSLWHTLREIDVRFFLVVIALECSDRFLMAYKWNQLLRARGVGFSSLEAFRIYLGSTFVATFLPGGVGGDVVRAVRTTIRGRPKERVAATILIERVLGLIALILLAFLGLAFVVRTNPGDFTPIFYGTGVFFAILIAGLVVSVQPFTFNLMHRLLTPWRRMRLVPVYLDMHTAYVELGRERIALAVFFALSFLEHVVMAFINYYGAKALGLSVDLVYFMAIIPIVILFSTLPISISAIGVREGVYVVLFGLAGVAPAEALSLSLLMRVVEFVVTLPSGLIYLHDTATSKAGRQTSAG